MLKPRMFYAFRLGPMEDDEGEPVFWYIGFKQSPAFKSVVAKQDEDGLRQLAELHGQGDELHCEPALAKVGKKVGFVPRPMPEWIRKARGFLAYGRGLGAYGGMLFDRDDLPLAELLAAAAKFMKAQPWQWWSEGQPLKFSVAGTLNQQFEGNISGFDRDSFGITLYSKPGALERMEAALAARDVKATLREDGMGLMVNPKPEWAAKAVKDAYGFWGIPVPVILRGGHMTEIDPLSLGLLCAAFDAASELRSDKLISHADWDFAGARFRMTIQAPAPIV